MVKLLFWCFYVWIFHLKYWCIIKRAAFYHCCCSSWSPNQFNSSHQWLWFHMQQSLISSKLIAGFISNSLAKCIRCSHNRGVVKHEYLPVHSSWALISSHHCSPINSHYISKQPGYTSHMIGRMVLSCMVPEYSNQSIFVAKQDLERVKELWRQNPCETKWDQINKLMPVRREPKPLIFISNEDRNWLPY